MSIHEAEGLHRAIGLGLVDAPRPLDGAELRFLRTELELTQAALAGILGTKEQTLRLWEKGCKKAIPGPVDRLLRAFYREAVTGDGSVKALVERFASLDEQAAGPIRMRDTPKGWRLETVAA